MDALKEKWWLILPNSNFILIWMLLHLGLQVYHATYLPYKICFIDYVTEGFLLYLEYFLDFLYFSDIIISFLTVLIDEKGNYESDLKVIARIYIKKGLWRDIPCCIPS